MRRMKIVMVFLKLDMIFDIRSSFFDCGQSILTNFDCSQSSSTMLNLVFDWSKNFDEDRN